VDVGGDQFELPIEVALPCGMLVSELVTNAYKYAFPNQRAGTIEIELFRYPTHAAIAVRDTGVGLPASFNPQQSTSFGWRLIQSLAGQIGGTLTVLPGAGTKVQVDFPAGALH
jgi:two-component sensor histidine kinase